MNTELKNAVKATDTKAQYDEAEGVLAAVILLTAEFCPNEKRHIISVFKLIQDLLAPSKIKGKNQFQLLMAKLPDTHKAKWFLFCRRG